ncbi:hypothetical protein [Novosphingobium sp. Leaf2]|uniref:hypothetical protein n=1 Tax=Novosphingobium sp. Leaf2 TaxID=1735670 RepID=UPI0006FDD127|nr:hypothetical protein [Novosphingobium sp. Leaf2]KQM14776.1 alpha/beta hydrolase [Novosphingobium sp. Leaf2]
MRALIANLALIWCCLAGPAAAQAIGYQTVDWNVEASPDGTERTVVVLSETVTQEIALPQGQAYGPFRVLDEGRAALVDVTDARTPALFAAMLRDHPGIGEIEMVECPGTDDDVANLAVGRMIRAHGLVTHVPADGSVRSGAVELFLAGVRRYADPGAEFAVHSWQDDTGHEPRDYAATAPENQRYLAYYRQMGMSAGQAAAFYAMTNSVPFASARWLDRVEMAHWAQLDGRPDLPGTPRVQLAVLDSAGPLP